MGCYSDHILNVFLLIEFFRLFKSNAYIKNIFHEFGGLETEDQMRENETLENHATLVMTTLDEAITNIANYDQVKEHLHRTGGSHQRFNDFEADNFRVCIVIRIILNQKKISTLTHPRNIWIFSQTSDHQHPE